MREIMVGCDESGRGSFFGPIYAGACIIEDQESFILNLPDHIKIRDSKKMSEKQRNESYQYIIEHCTAYSSAYITNTEIDEIGIQEANKKVFHKALDKLKQYNFNKILVDGCIFKPYYDDNLDVIYSECIPKGDDNVLEIACASIIAKYTRDQFIETICNENEEYKKYNIKANKGYGTYAHIQGIKSHGLTNLHRSSFLKHFL